MVLRLWLMDPYESLRSFQGGRGSHIFIIIKMYLLDWVGYSGSRLSYHHVWGPGLNPQPQGYQECSLYCWLASHCMGRGSPKVTCWPLVWACFICPIHSVEKKPRLSLTLLTPWWTRASPYFNLTSSIQILNGRMGSRHKTLQLSKKTARQWLELGTF